MMGDEDKKEDGKSLLLFQLGPVQSFIAQAETIADLKAGSVILSRLTAAALKCVPRYWEAAVFPAVEENKLDGIPNRFLAFVPKDGAEAIARKATTAAQEELVKLAQPAREKLPSDRRDAFDRQIAQFLQTSWSILKTPAEGMGDNYKSIGKLMAMRRNTRWFNAWQEEATGEVKDFLSGKEAALDLAGGVSRKSGRGAMNLVKLTLADQDLDTIRKTALKHDDYIAVIAMDGDHMGAKLSGFKTQSDHRDFSRKLAEQANAVQIDREDGVLIYAGGDDVLAVVKATKAFEIAERLADDFVKALNKGDERTITASVGIAIGSAKAPLQDLVHEAHAAESRAKKVYGRDALAVNVLKRSGEILHWGCNWKVRKAVMELDGKKQAKDKQGQPKYEYTRDERGELVRCSALDLYAGLAQENGKLSGYSYKLAGFLMPYELGKWNDTYAEHIAWQDMKRIIRAEAFHSVEQMEHEKKLLLQKMEPTIAAWLDEETVEKHPEDFLGLFMCEAFINRDR